MRKIVASALVVSVIAYLATGLAVVQQDEEGVERRFGAVQPDPLSPGLHWTLPWGLGRIDRVKTGQTRTVSVGAQSLQSAPLTRSPNPEAEDFLTGDWNLATVQAIVQYRVKDPARFLFSSTSAEKALVLAAEASLTRVLAGKGIDDVLTVGRAQIADEVRPMLQAEADAENLGVTIYSVRLGRVAPPVPVAPAFADADRARSDRRQLVTAAEEYRDRTRSEARGQAREVLDRARAQHDQALASARGEAYRFEKVLVAASDDLPATRQRLYLELLTELLPRFQRKVVVAPGRDLDVSLFADSEAPVPMGPDASSATPSLTTPGGPGR
jgi:membrane protease subunit HflK